MRYRAAIGYVLAFAVCFAASEAGPQTHVQAGHREAPLAPYRYVAAQVATDGTQQDAPFGLAPDGASLYPLPSTLGNSESPTQPEEPPAIPVPAEPSYQAATRAEMVAWLQAAGWEGTALEEALRVAYCESHWIPGNSNGLFRGLFQISLHSNATLKGTWFDWAGYSNELWADPVTNAKVALLMWQYAGWGNWQCIP